MSGKIKMIMEWVRCPVCRNKTRLQIRAGTELKNFPLYCPKCKLESLIDAKNLQITVIKEPTACEALRSLPEEKRETMTIVVKHYESYITSLSMRKLYDERGNVYWGIDEDIRDRLRSRLMRAVLSFKV